MWFVWASETSSALFGHWKLAAFLLFDHLKLRLHLFYNPMNLAVFHLFDHLKYNYCIFDHMDIIIAPLFDHINLTVFHLFDHMKFSAVFSFCFLFDHLIYNYCVSDHMNLTVFHLFDHMKHNYCIFILLFKTSAMVNFRFGNFFSLFLFDTVGERLCLSLSSYHWPCLHVVYIIFVKSNPGLIIVIYGLY